MYEQQAQPDDHESAGFLFEDMALMAEKWAKGEEYATLRDQLATELISQFDNLLEVESVNKFGLLSPDNYEQLWAMRASVVAEAKATLGPYADEIDHWINNHQGTLHVKVSNSWSEVDGVKIVDGEILPTINAVPVTIDVIEAVRLLNTQPIQWNRDRIE